MLFRISDCDIKRDRVVTGKCGEGGWIYLMSFPALENSFPQAMKKEAPEG